MRVDWTTSATPNERQRTLRARRIPSRDDSQGPGDPGLAAKRSSRSGSGSVQAREGRSRSQRERADPSMRRRHRPVTVERNRHGVGHDLGAGVRRGSAAAERGVE